MTTPVLDLQNVQLQQGGNTIIESASFNMFPGELVYLVGKTGSGKTSLLRSLYADLDIMGGQAFVSGFKVNNISRKRIPFMRRKLGIIFQDFQLLTDRNIEQNLLFVMKSTGWKKKNLMQNRLTEVLELVGLQDRGKSYPYELSGGEQQRVAVARALINDPAVILADEPSGNLDSNSAENLHELFFKLRNSFGQTFVIVTHNNELAAMADRKLVMKDGVII